MGKMTVTVSNHSGLLSGTRFWKRLTGRRRSDSASSGGPAAHPAQRTLAYGEVVLNEVELGLAPLGEEDLVGIRYTHGAPVDVEIHIRTSHDLPPYAAAIPTRVRSSPMAVG